MEELPKRRWFDPRPHNNPVRYWLQFSLRLLFFLTAFVGLTCATYSLPRGSWQQFVAAVLLLLIVLGGIAWVTYLNMREAQARNRRYEPGSTGTRTPEVF